MGGRELLAPVDDVMPETQATRLGVGALSLVVEDGAARRIAFGDVEAVRRIDCPVRDADWRTSAVEEIRAESGPGLRYLRQFRTVDGAFEGAFGIEGEADGMRGRIEADLQLTALRDTVVNRAGFVVLHPVAGVAGTPVDVTGPDGRLRAEAFPALISPSQPVFDIAGLRHRVGPVEVTFAMQGEVFEMEDQRNWTDASFKTYCRPLARPRPFRIAAGETIRQHIVVTFEMSGETTRGMSGERPEGVEGETAGERTSVRAQAQAQVPAAAKPAATVMPQIVLAHEAALCRPVPQAVARLEVAGVLLRVDANAPEIDAITKAPITLEIVADSASDVAQVRAACVAAGLLPQRVVGVPRGYLASHQPEGPWPTGLTPEDLVALLRDAFPEAETGGGMLTNFAEFNRRRVALASVDFVTFGTTAIVHAADDASVLETLETLGDVFATTRALSGDRPMRLGLLAIGMRSNPYGAAVAAASEGRRVPMAMDDPRQHTQFGAAFAVGVAAAASRGGVASYAPSMTGGPLGLGAEGALWPIFTIVEALADLAGAEVEASGEPSSGVVTLRGRGRHGVTGIVANLGPSRERVDGLDLPAFGTAVLRGSA